MLHAALARFNREEAGATAIEYGLIAALVAVAVLGAMSVMGVSLQSLYAGGTASAAAVIGSAADGL